MRAEEAELKALSDKFMEDNKQAGPSDSCIQSLVGDLLTQSGLSSAPRWVSARPALLSVCDFSRFSALRSPPHSWSNALMPLHRDQKVGIKDQSAVSGGGRGFKMEVMIVILSAFNANLLDLPQQSSTDWIKNTNVHGITVSSI